MCRCPSAADTSPALSVRRRDRGGRVEVGDAHPRGSMTCPASWRTALSGRASCSAAVGISSIVHTVGSLLPTARSSIRATRTGVLGNSSARLTSESCAYTAASPCWVCSKDAVAATAQDTAAPATRSATPTVAATPAPDVLPREDQQRGRPAWRKSLHLPSRDEVNGSCGPSRNGWHRASRPTDPGRPPRTGSPPTVRRPTPTDHHPAGPSSTCTLVTLSTGPPMLLTGGFGRRRGAGHSSRERLSRR